MKLTKRMRRTVMVRIRNQNAPKSPNSSQKLACHFKNKRNKLNESLKNKQISKGIRPTTATRTIFSNQRSMSPSLQMTKKMRM